MKKIMILLIVAILLAGCSSKKMTDEEAKSLLSGSVENIAFVNADIDFTVTDETNAVSVVKMKLRNAEDSSKMNAHMVVSASGMELTYYIKDGYMYMDIFGMKVKTKVEASTLDNVVDLDDMVDDFSDIDDSRFKRFKVEDKGDVVVYTFIATKEDLEEFGISDGSIIYTVDKKTKKLLKLDMDVKEGTIGKIAGTFDFTASSVLEFPDLSGYVSYEE